MAMRKTIWISSRCVVKERIWLKELLNQINNLCVLIVDLFYANCKFILVLSYTKKLEKRKKKNTWIKNYSHHLKLTLHVPSNSLTFTLKKNTRKDYLRFFTLLIFDFYFCSLWRPQQEKELSLLQASSKPSQNQYHHSEKPIYDGESVSNDLLCVCMPITMPNIQCFLSPSLRIQIQCSIVLICYAAFFVRYANGSVVFLAHELLV